MSPPGDIFILCSDGITKMLSDLTINQTCRRLARNGVTQLAHGLIQEANDAGGFDNSSVVVIALPEALPAAATMEIRPGETVSTPISVTPPTEVISRELVRKAEEREVLLRRTAQLRHVIHIALALAILTAAAIGVVLLYRLLFL